MHALTLEQTASWLRNALIIHCRPSYSKLAAGVRKEIQMDGVILNHRQLIEAYDKLMGELEMMEVQVIRYDFTGPFSPLLRSIHNYIEEQRNG